MKNKVYHEKQDLSRKTKFIMIHSGFMKNEVYLKYEKQFIMKNKVFFHENKVYHEQRQTHFSLKQRLSLKNKMLS